MIFRVELTRTIHGKINAKKLTEEFPSEWEEFLEGEDPTPELYREFLVESLDMIDMDEAADLLDSAMDEYDFEVRA